MAELAAFVTEVGTGDSIPRPEHRGQTVTDVVDAHLRFLEEDKGRKHSTLVRYRTLHAYWLAPALGEQRAEVCCPRTSTGLLVTCVAPGRARVPSNPAFTLLNGAFKWSRRNRRICRNPMIEVEKPQSTKPTQECGTELVPDAFVFTHSADGATPVRPEYLTRRMRALRRRSELEQSPAARPVGRRRGEWSPRR